MALKTEREDGTLVAQAEGRIDALNAREFQDELSGAIGDDTGSTVLDMESLTYISSAGLRVILLIAKDRRKHDSKLVLCSLPEPIREVFETSGFDQIIPIYPSRAEALASLGG